MRHATAAGREVVGRGRTADVLAWGRGRVLKLFRPDFPGFGVAAEAEATRAARAAGLPVPAVHSVVQVEGRWGIVCERVEGPSMQAVLDQGMPDYTPMARTLGRLHAQLHERPPVGGLPSVHALVQMQIGWATNCPEDTRRAALSAIDALPRGDRLYHGDFHPGNVILARSGPVIIDWTCGRMGDPAADVARSLLLMSLDDRPDHDPMAAIFGRFRRAYLRGYRSVRPLDRNRARAWRLPLLAARLSEWPPPEEEQRVLMELRALVDRTGSIPSCRSTPRASPPPATPHPSA